MSERIVLGLDQSMHMGFCVGSPGAKFPIFGMWSVPDYAGNDGRTFWAVEKWLVNFIKSNGVTDVFWEQVFIMPGRVDMGAIFKMVSYANAIQAACEDSDRGIAVPNACVNQLSWRSQFNGTPKGGTDFQKELAIATCAGRGWQIKSHHVAEACGIWDYGCMVVDRKTHEAAWPQMPKMKIKLGEARNGELSKANART